MDRFFSGPGPDPGSVALGRGSVCVGACPPLHLRKRLPCTPYPDVIENPVGCAVLGDSPQDDESRGFPRHTFTAEFKVKEVMHSL